MNTTFDSLLERLTNIKINDWTELNKIKLLSFELLKRSFPNDNLKEIHQIENLRFKSNTLIGTSNWSLNDFTTWNRDLATFSAILEAKKETFDLLQQKELKLSALKIANRMNPYEVENFSLRKEVLEANNKLLQNLTEYKEELEDSLSKNSDLSKELAKSKSKIKTFNIAYWGIIIGIAATVFPFGIYLGYNRFDAEKLSMRDSINSLQQQNQKLKKQLVPLIKPVKP